MIFPLKLVDKYKSLSNLDLCSSKTNLKLIRPYDLETDIRRREVCHKMNVLEEK